MLYSATHLEKKSLAAGATEQESKRKKTKMGKKWSSGGVSNTNVWHKRKIKLAIFAVADREVEAYKIVLLLISEAMANRLAKRVR